GGRFRDLSLLGGGRVLALRQPVYLVVEEKDLQVDVSPQGVDEVVAPDGEAVPVAGDDPDLQVGAARGDARGNRRRAPVDPMDPVGVHVIRETARAPDTGHEDRLLPRDPK